MRFAVPEYATIVFDCDGVILDSNRVKSDAFHRVSSRFGSDLADRFVSYHQRHGGVSRYRKFAHLVDDMLETRGPDREALLGELLETYSALCAAGLRQCALIPGISAFIDRLTPDVAAFVVTGGDQQEVRGELVARDLGHRFIDILGSPVSKREHMLALAGRGAFGDRAAYFGDAALDRQLAEEFGLDFVFVYGASEWPEGRTVCGDRQIADFTELV